MRGEAEWRNMAARLNVVGQVYDADLRLVW